MRAARVRFYFDADILGVAQTIALLRNDCTHPGDPGVTINKRTRPACPITETEKRNDTLWVPKVTSLGWLAITRDHNIRENPSERRAVRESGCRMVALSGVDAGTKWAQLRLLMIRWPSIEALLDKPGPFIYLARFSSGLRLLKLDD